MLIEHRGHRPTVHDSAYIAPTAIISGEVTIGPGVRVLHGAIVSAEDGPVTVGENVVIMEHAVIRGRARHPVTIGDAVMIGPHTHLNGTTVGSTAFIATGASLFPGSRIGAGAEVRINAVVQVNTRIEDAAIVPIGWIAVGDPAQILPPDQHERIWAVQRELDFPGTVYGASRKTTMAEIMAGQSELYGSHRDDVAVDGPADGAPNPAG